MSFRYISFIIALFISITSIGKNVKFQFFDAQTAIKIDSTDFKDARLDSIANLIKNDRMEPALSKLYAIIDDNERKKDSANLLESYMLIGDVLRDNGDYENSNSYFRKALPIAKLNDDTLQYIYFKKGGNFQQLQALDSALMNYEKAIAVGLQIKNSENLKAKIHGNLSGVYFLKQDFTKAIEHSEIAAGYQKVLGNKDIEAGILNNLGGIYYMQGNYKMALEKFQEALVIVGYGQSDLQKQTRNSTYINLSYAYSGLGDYKRAYEFQDRYFSLNDSLQNDLKYKELAEIESKYRIQNKANEAEAEKAKRQKSEILSFSLGLAALVLLIGIYIFYKLYVLNKKNYKLQLEQKDLVHKRNIDKLKSESQFKILAATLDGRLEERKKIASVLHDNVSALLSAANLHLHAVKNNFTKERMRELDKTQEIILEASEKIRDLSHKLVPAILLKFGLKAALKDICEKLSNSTLTLISETKNVERFQQDFEIKVYNIINELLNNILKHSKAQTGLIKLEQIEGNLQIIVVDDGLGFDKNSTTEPGVGLSQVEARVLALKGIIKINSKAKDTRIFISVPAQY